MREKKRERDGLESEDFVAGEDVTHLLTPKQGPGGIVVSVRLTHEDAMALFEVAERQGRGIAQVTRDAIRAYLLQIAGLLEPLVGPEDRLLFLGEASRQVDEVVSSLQEEGLPVPEALLRWVSSLPNKADIELARQQLETPEMLALVARLNGHQAP